MAAKMRIKRDVVAVASKASDLEVHVSVLTVTTMKERWIDIRDYVPSTKTYGRGVVLNLDQAGMIYDALAFIEANPGNVGATA